MYIRFTVKQNNNLCGWNSQRPKNNFEKKKLKVSLTCSSPTHNYHPAMPEAISGWGMSARQVDSGQILRYSRLQQEFLRWTPVLFIFYRQVSGDFLRIIRIVFCAIQIAWLTIFFEIIVNAWRSAATVPTIAVKWTILWL